VSEQGGSAVATEQQGMITTLQRLEDELREKQLNELKNQFIL